MIEVLTLKLAIDLFDHLKTYKMELSMVKVMIWKKYTNQFQYFTFNSYNELWDFYYNRYYPFDLCESFGDIWCVTEFKVDTDLDTSYTMSFSAYDINNKEYWIKDNSQFDNDRNHVWAITKERQKELLSSILKEYRSYYLELYEIYLQGVYSVCYAEPGWTTHTTRLKSYKDILFPENTNNNTGFIDIQID